MVQNCSPFSTSSRVLTVCQLVISHTLIDSEQTDSSEGVEVWSEQAEKEKNLWICQQCGDCGRKGVDEGGGRRGINGKETFNKNKLLKINIEIKNYILQR